MQPRCSVPGVADPVAATVSLISPALDPGSTTVEVWLKIDNKTGKLKVGTPVKVSITGRTVAKALEDSGCRDPDRAGRQQVGHGGGRATARRIASRSRWASTDGDDVQVTGGLARERHGDHRRSLWAGRRHEGDKSVRQAATARAEGTD